VKFNMLKYPVKLFVPYTSVYKTHFFPHSFVSKSGWVLYMLLEFFKFTNHKKLIPNADIFDILFMVMKWRNY